LKTHLDLFSGIGGFALAAQWAGFETIAFSEVDPYATAILKKHWPNVPNLGDIRNVTRRTLADANGFRQLQQERNLGEIRRRTRDGSKETADAGADRLCDLITGGFPCQPFSLAGKRRGSSDDRALWPEMFRVIAETAPAFVLAENVPGIVNLELDRCLSDLESIGYTTWPPFIIPACALDAKHRRNRVWIMAHANKPRLERRNGGSLQERTDKQPARADRPHSPDAGRGHNEPARWEPEPAVCRVAHGIPFRMDRLKCLGNAIVPQVAAEILIQLTQSRPKPQP